MIAPHGWNTWDVRRVNAMVHLPSRLRVTFSLFDPIDQVVKEDFTWRTELRRLGPHAGDGSYCQLDLQWGAAMISLVYATQDDRLVCCATPHPGAEHLLVQVSFDGAWGSTVTLEGWETKINAQAVDLDPPCRVRLNDGPVFFEIAPRGYQPALAPAELIAQQQSAYTQAGLRTAGWLGEAAEALTRVITWNTIWEPIKGRMCTPVSRDWCKGPSFGSYVLFEWDTFFCAVMAQLEDGHLADANVRAILQEVTSAGFVPNFGCEFGPSADRSQPPVGAYCVLKMYCASALSNARRRRALLEHAFPPLARWHAWWMPHRDGNQDGLLEWGSDPAPGCREVWQFNSLQAAMYESGLDNSPMYDEVAFNPHTHTMELADVGLNALYALDAWALSEIARELDQPTLSQDYAAEYAEMAERINRQLWNEEAGIYLNRHWDGRFSPHLSPTLFYPLIAGIAPPTRAERMVREHLLNPNAFWGRFVLPSIARSDPGYAGNDYWRGRIWGPMNFLVSEGLRRYRLDAATYELARRSLDLLLHEWRAEGHVHENYNADTGDGDDMPNSDPRYTWGALLGYIAIQELVDYEPWAGWRFGNLSSDAAAIHGVRVEEGMLDVESSAEGLRVTLNGAPIIVTDRPARITAYQRGRTRLACHIDTGDNHAVKLHLGDLPAGETAQVQLSNGAPQSHPINRTGTIEFTIHPPCKIDITF
ncbi:MAG: trehalase family glycosidase [Anaerolineae bacterium]|nr:trehalase family glycosidase [Thermoflexales bacterium]MDW8407828.1 trehalase family glycosidase [Anaerolineae bacterium]